jgi:hypothetical protein
VSPKRRNVKGRDEVRQEVDSNQYKVVSEEGDAQSEERCSGKAISVPQGNPSLNILIRERSVSEKSGSNQTDENDGSNLRKSASTLQEKNTNESSSKEGESSRSKGEIRETGQEAGQMNKAQMGFQNREQVDKALREGNGAEKRHNSMDYMLVNVDKAMDGEGIQGATSPSPGVRNWKRLARKIPKGAL